MIDKLQIQNFQCHSKRKIELDGVTSVIGPSDSGKSAIIRALRWICQNTPQGDQFIKDGAKGCTAVLELDGHSVKRRKGKGINEYYLDGKVFKSFGTSVPDSVTKVLNISDLNFQGQHDAPFWFSDTAGQVSKNLNAIVDLQLIDECLSNAGSRVRKAKTEKEIVESKLKEFTEICESLEWTVECIKLLKKIKKLEQYIEDIENKQAKLKRILVDIEELKLTIEECEQNYNSMKNVLKLGKKTKDLMERKNKLKEIISSIKTLESIQPIDTTEVDKLYTKYLENRGVRDKLRNIINAIRERSKQYEFHKNRTEELEEELHKSTNGVCPVCGKEM
jgi:exonuclease SbcC